ncbi:hypothetical protein Tco_0426557, partial [Tanacetum coccineum]
IKEEDTITNVENAVLDLGVMDPLCRSKSSHRLDHEVRLNPPFEPSTVRLVCG